MLALLRMRSVATYAYVHVVAGSGLSTKVIILARTLAVDRKIYTFMDQLTVMFRDA
jgi:hypothetical protein